MSPWAIAGLAVACLVALFSILAVIGSFIGPAPTSPTAAAHTQAAVALAPTTQAPAAAPTTAAAPSPTVAATTAAALAPPPTTAAAPPWPATHKPAPAPTARQPAPKTPTKKPVPKPTKPSAQHGVHPGAFCAPEGAIGYTVKGTKMRCTFKSSDIRARWRSA